MTANLNFLSLWLFAGLILTSCTVSNPKFFTGIQPTVDTTYGYTAQNPVMIKNADLQNSINSSYYYLSKLRTENGNKLQFIQRYSVDNPDYNKPAIQLQNRYTGKTLNHNNGPLLDLYILKPENEIDTIKIYINPYLKGDIKIPSGLKFEQ